MNNTIWTREQNYSQVKYQCLLGICDHIVIRIVMMESVKEDKSDTYFLFVNVLSAAAASEFTAGQKPPSPFSIHLKNFL